MWQRMNVQNHVYPNKTRCTYVRDVHQLSNPVILVKNWFTQISTLVIFNQYLSNTNWYILETYQ